MTLSETIEMCMLTGVTISFSNDNKNNSYSIRVSRNAKEATDTITLYSYNEQAVILSIKRMLLNL